MEDNAIVEVIVHADIFLYDIDIVDGTMVGELGEVSGNTLILYGFYVITVIFAKSPL